MADNKKSFLLYCDIIHTVKKLPKEKVADLFLHILEYVNDENPTTNDMLIEIAFEPIKQALKRDLKKWEKYIAKQKDNGSKGGRPLTKKPTKPKKTHGLNSEPKKPREPVSAIAIVSAIEFSSENIIQSLAKYKEDFGNDFELHRMAMQENKFSPSQLEQAKTEFWNVKELDSETCAKPYKDIKKHFLNWCRKNKTRIHDTKNGNDKKHGRVNENDLKSFITGQS